MTRTSIAAAALRTCLILTFLAPLLAGAQEQKPEAKADESLPPARQIIDRFVKEIGGAEAMSKVKSQRFTGTMNMEAQGIKGRLELLVHRPNKMLITANIPGLGDIVQGYDGNIAWAANPATGPMLIEGKMLEQMKDQANFDSFLHREEDIKSMKTTGAKRFEDRDTYEVTVVRKSGYEVKEYFDRKTGLLYGMVMEQETPFGALAVTNILDGYRQFGDIKVATQITQKMGPIEQAMTIDSVELNKVDEAAFNPPPEVKALAGKDTKPQS